MSHMTDNQEDWFEDESVSFDEAMARFKALGPEAGPTSMLGGAMVLTPPKTFSSGYRVKVAPPALTWPVHELVTTRRSSR